MTIAVTDLAVRPVDEKFATLALRNRTSPVYCLALGGNDSRYTLGAFTPPSPLVAMRDDMDVVVFSHNAGCGPSFVLDLRGQPWPKEPVSNDEFPESPRRSRG